MKSTLNILFILLLLLRCSSEPKKNIPLFTKSELNFTNNIQNSTKLNILNYLYFYNGAGTAVADFNNDGLNDIVLISNLESHNILLNTNNLTFSKIIIDQETSSKFTTGITTVDINNDGLLDIYLSQVSNHLNLSGSNKLYINQGEQNGTLHFEEKSKEYGLNLNGFFTQSTFFDYDLDGDLDVFLLKHSIHPNSTYNRGSIRYKKDPQNGDILLRNDNGLFTDVSIEAGILQTKISYGLGISTSDINNDGYPDIYIGNDFFENDYLYINQGNGTFKEVNTTENSLKHTSHFSMGNDIADINNDGFADIISMDMLPENIATLKSAGTEYGFPIYQNQLKYGYQPQFMQNTLHLNQSNGQFVETAFQSGISATEWSWSPLIADFDADGFKDLYITNGIAGATNDMDFINFISNDEIQKKLGTGMSQEDLDFIKKLPPKITPNYFYKNNTDNTFTDITSEWSDKASTLSNGATYADIDNDGDLDIVVNNVNSPAFILENRTAQLDSINYLKIKFKGPEKNVKGIGSKVLVYQNKNIQKFENFTTRGYLSATAPEINVGLGSIKSIDSLKVIWPSKKYQTLYNIRSNQTITVNHANALGDFYAQKQNTVNQLLSNSPLPIKFTHHDATSLDFNRDPLIPYAASNLGPQIATGDLNNDTLDDIVTLGAKGQETTIQFQEKDGSFLSKRLDISEDFKIHEDVTATIFDANSDGLNDLLIASGGNEFKQGVPLQPRLYIQEEDGLRFRESAFTNIELNASKISIVDFDNDGDLDACIVANVVPREFGETPKHYLFENDGSGDFINCTLTKSEAFHTIGNVHDIEWKDIDGNGYVDAILMGHWMPIEIFLNDGKEFTLLKTNLSSYKGWWNSIAVEDFDKDGDLDIVVGNWGNNTRLKASTEEPIRLYRNDFDNNGRIDPLVTYYYQGKETTIATKDELVKQLPFINKKFLSYNAFATADLDDIFTKKQLDDASKKEVTTLATMYFENKGNGNFETHILPFMAQVSSVMDIFVDDFNNDTYMDLLLVGNNYEISTQLGRLDGLNGLILINDQKGNFITQKQQNFNISGPARSVTKLDIKGKTHYIVGLNNAAPILLEKIEN